jgi:hypothetical protein
MMESTYRIERINHSQVAAAPAARDHHALPRRVPRARGQRAQGGESGAGLVAVDQAADYLDER